MHQTQVNAGHLPRIEVLDSAECYRLLGTQQLGRIAVNGRSFPQVFPVNYAMDGPTVVFRAGRGSLLDAVSHANVAFEVDASDPVTREGWDVVIDGLAEQVTAAHGAELLERTTTAGADPWAPVDDDVWVRILVQGLRGRRVVSGRGQRRPVR